MKIILASKSPRRKDLMDLLDIDYEVMVSNAEETLENGLSILEQIKRLAYIKAKTIFEQTEGERIVIGADTIVVKDSKIHGKPKDRKEAYNMLQQLKNGKHQVISSICIIENEEEYISYDITDVYVKNMTDKEINNWLDKNEYLDKAGAYAIQGGFAKHIEKIDGNYSTVVGLPIHKVYDRLKYLNVL